MKKGGGREGSVAMKNFFKRLLNEEQGQSTIEYILMLAIVVLIAMKFKSQFTAQMEKLVGKVGSQIDDATNN